MQPLPNLDTTTPSMQKKMFLSNLKLPPLDSGHHLTNCPQWVKSPKIHLLLMHKDKLKKPTLAV